MKNKGTIVEAEAAKELEGKVVEGKVGATEKKKQKASKSYTLKSMKANITKLVEMELISEEDGKVIEEIRKEAVAKYIENEF